MSEKEYVVTPNKGVDYAQSNPRNDSFHRSVTFNRTIDVANARHLSQETHTTS